MSDVVATPVNDPEIGAEHIDRLTGGHYTGERFYIINTRRMDRAVRALGLPADGEPWSEEFPTLRCRQLALRQWGGQDSEITGVNGRSIAVARYSTPGSDGRLPPPQVGDKWTEIRPATQTITTRFDVRAPSNTNPFLNLPIAGGDGAPKTVGQTQLIVHTFYPDFGAIPWVKLIDFQTRGVVNDDQVEVPPAYGQAAGGPSFVFSKGQLRFETYEVIGRLSGEEGLVEVAVVLIVAKDHLFRWVQEDEKGNALGSVAWAQLYEEDDFGGLW